MKDREKYLENTGGIGRMQVEELLDRIEQLEKFLGKAGKRDGKRDEEIERLRQEKEWLVWKAIGDERYGLFSSGKAEKIRVLKEMQQALKEK